MYPQSWFIRVTRRQFIAGVPSVVIELPATRNGQLRSWWCWAAVAAMIFDVNGHRVSQGRIVSEAFGAPYNRGPSVRTFLDVLNRDYIDDHGRPFRVAAGMPTLDEAISDLANDFPAIVATGRHVMLLTGIEYTDIYDPRAARPRGRVIEAVYVRDPAEGGRRRALSHDEWESASLLLSVRVLDPFMS